MQADILTQGHSAREFNSVFNRKKEKAMKKSIIFLLFLVIFSSCKKVLEENPKDFISRTNYYTNQSDAEGAITGAYSSLADNYAITYWLFLVLHSDYSNGRGSQAPIPVFDQILNQANINRAAAIWSSFYTTINRANSVLDNVPAIIDITDDAKKRILGEAYFLRAMAYFNLVRGFGPVPIKINESIDLSKVGSPREPENKVYDLIIQDALAAESSLPASVGAETGRAPKWAAKMLLAEVYLTLEKWQEAADKADEIIQGGAYSLVLVNKPSDFYNIFATVTNSEDILSIHHSDSRQSDIAIYLHRPNTPPYNYSSGGNYAWLPILNSFIGSSWNDNDLRKSFNLYDKYVGPNGDSVSLPSTSPVLFKKFITNTSGLRTFSDPIFRYSEAFLIYAEAAAMKDGAPSALALERLNVIKRRGYGFDPFTASPVDYPSALDINAFRDIVIQERAYEFLVEGKRWWDLKRTGKVKGAMSAIGKTFIDARYLWPIAADEINNNPELTQADQNPGY